MGSEGPEEAAAIGSLIADMVLKGGVDLCCCSCFFSLLLELYMACYGPCKCIAES